MTSILFYSVTICVLILIVLTPACYRLKRNKKLNTTDKVSEESNKTDKTYLCSSCLTGEECYRMDNSSFVCPYVAYLKNGKCSYYKALKK